MQVIVGQLLKRYLKESVRGWVCFKTLNETQLTELAWEDKQCSEREQVMERERKREREREHVLVC